MSQLFAVARGVDSGGGLPRPQSAGVRLQISAHYFAMQLCLNRAETADSLRDLGHRFDTDPAHQILKGARVVEYGLLDD